MGVRVLIVDDPRPYREGPPGWYVLFVVSDRASRRSAGPSRSRRR
jgi:hypothetical protein